MFYSALFLLLELICTLCLRGEQSLHSFSTFCSEENNSSSSPIFVSFLKMTGGPIGQQTFPSQDSASTPLSRVFGENHNDLDGKIDM